MSWTFKTRYKEHIKDIINSKPNPGFSQNALEMKHTYIDINECMDNLPVHRKDKHSNILEQLPIYKNAKLKPHLNNTYRDAFVSIFDVILNFKVGEWKYTTS